MQTLDWHLFQLVNGLAGRVPAVDGLMVACALGLEYVLLFLVATLWVTPANDERATLGRQSLVIYAVLAALLALGINQLIGLAWFRPRPFAAHPVNLLIRHANDTSFPSDHAAGGFALATTLLIARDRWARRIGWLLLVLTVLLAFARVYTGLHYPSDVIAGGLIGFGSAAAIRLLEPLADPILRRLLQPVRGITRNILGRLGAGGWRVSA